MCIRFHTWIERDRKRLTLAALESGVPVEVLTDLRAGRCYTRIIRLIPAAVALMPVARRKVATPVRNAIESLYPRGDLTFAGVVLRRSPTVLVVRTRTDPEKMITLREDTRYVDSGLPTTLGQLAVNTRVFIRGGKNFENTLEAYQVMCGARSTDPRPSILGKPAAELASAPCYNSSESNLQAHDF